MATSGKHQNKSSIKGSDFLYDLVCKPCHLDDIVKPAFGYCADCDEHLCSMCYVNHKKSRPSRYHKLLDSSSMPTTQTLYDIDTTVDEGPSDSLNTPCEKHSEEYIKFYCNDHKVTLCSVCVALKHNKPCKVDNIPDISNSVLNSDLFREIIARAQSLEIKSDSVKNGISRDIQHTIDSLKRSRADLKKYRKVIKRRLDTKEKGITKTIAHLTTQNNNIIKTTETKCEVIKADAKLQKDRLNAMNESKQSNQLFIELQQTTKILDQYEDSFKSIESQHHRDEYRFIPNKALQHMLEAENALGTISPQDDKSLPSPSDTPSPRHQDTNIKPTQNDEILVKTVGDEEDCWISGMTEICPGVLVLADTENSSVKLVDVNRKAVTSSISIESYLWDLTTISSTEVAVTVPDGRYIQFITVSNKLKTSRRINTNGECRGICYHQDKLIVTYSEPGKLEILDMRGKVIKSVMTDTTGKYIFSLPWHLQVTDAYIFVSDEGYNNITKLDWDCQIISRREEVEHPVGLALIKDRSRLIACSQVSDCLYELDNDNMKMKVILQDVECPYAVCVNHQNNKLFISRYSLNETLDNTILVYDI